MNPFLQSFQSVMPQIGFQSIEKGRVSIQGRELEKDGVIIILGIVGDLKGNVVYSMSMENAKAIASKMMFGMAVDELDDMAQSALSELSNMLTATASTEFSNIGININISTPILMYGNGFATKMSTDKVLFVEVFVDNIPIEVNISIESSK